MTLTRDVVPGVHRIEDSVVNWYLVEGDGRLTIVDCGVPRSWKSLHAALDQLGFTTRDVAAIVLTHAHYDHVGFAERARRELGLPIWLHPGDAELVKRPLRLRAERGPLRYSVIPNGGLRSGASLALHGALFTKGVTSVRPYEDGAVLDVPGKPLAVHTPGHTDGHCSLHLRDRDALIAGDAIVTFDPYTGKRGPRLVAKAATHDVEQAMGSLDAIARTGAGTLLVGHGEPYTDGAERAAELAHREGAA